MNKQYIDLLATVRSDGYKIGYADGRELANREHKMQYDRINNDLHIVQKRAAWLQDKLIRTKENYEGQVANLEKKLAHYMALAHYEEIEKGANNESIHS